MSTEREQKARELLFANPNFNQKSMGGTELMMRRLYNGVVDPALLEQVNIIPSRVRYMDSNKPNILWLHDLPEDPESRLDYSKFDGIVCVSEHQAKRYNMVHGIPFSRMKVIPNAIDFSEGWHNELKSKVFDKWLKLLGVGVKPTFKLVYHTTPHRGLALLVPIFCELRKELADFVNLELHVFSSFAIYGWSQRDEAFAELFKRCEEEEGITLHKNLPHADMLRFLRDEAHLFAYPSIWEETFCLAGVEAICAGAYVVATDYGCLEETLYSGRTAFVRFSNNLPELMSTYKETLRDTIKHQALCVHPGQRAVQISDEASYASSFFDWQQTAEIWDAYLRGILTKE